MISLNVRKTKCMQLAMINEKRIAYLLVYTSVL